MDNIRALSGYERIFYNCPEANVSIVGRIRGTVSRYAIEQVIGAVVAGHPVLATCLMKTDDNRVHFVKRERPELSFRSIARESVDQWQSVIAEENLRPFEFETGPLIRFVLLASENASDLVLYCQHTICDGLSLTELLFEILRLVSDSAQKLPSHQEEMTSLDKLVDRPKDPAWLRFLKHVVIQGMNKKWKKTEFVFDRQDFLNLHDRYFKKFAYRPGVIELSEEQTLSIVRACKRMNVSVNSALMVALGLGQRLVFPELKNELNGLGVNIRRRFENLEIGALGCFVGDLGFRFRYQTEKSFWENAALHTETVRSELDKLKDLQSVLGLELLDQGLIEAMTFARHRTYTKETAEKKHIASEIAAEGAKEYPGLLVTNLGNLVQNGSFGGFELERIVFAPSAVPVPEGGLIVGVVTYRGKMSVTVNSVEEKGSRELSLLQRRAVQESLWLLASECDKLG